MKTSSDTRPRLSRKAQLPVDPELKEILKHNPFGKDDVQKEWACKLRALRKGERGPCNLDFDFVLADDKKFILDARLVKQVRSMVLPQPWTGHPQAPVWLLLLNPGFCLKDFYDHINVSKKMRECIVRTGSYTSQSFDSSGAETKLENRQGLILSNLRFDSWPAPFYFLDDSFKTGNDGAVGHSWWFRHLSLKGGSNSFFSDLANNEVSWAETIGRCLFVLEAFPYHSSTFPGNMIRKWVKAETNSFNFWKRLVQYGLTHKKEIVVRATGEGCGSLGNLLKEAEINLASPEVNAKVHYVNNTRNISFTAGNIEDSDDSVKTAISTALGRC